MKINPVYSKETTIGSRSFHLPLIVLVFNGVLSMMALLNMYSVTSGLWITGEIQYSSFLDLYAFLAACEFLVLLSIIPALTAGMISGERERRTLDILLTTRMTPAEFVIGKMLSAIVTIAVLMISSIPVLSLVFIYGGVTITDITALFGCYLVTAVFAGSVGICISSFFRRTVISMATVYGTLTVLFGGSFILNWFSGLIENIGAMGDTVANFSRAFYLQLFNPAVTFFVLMKRQVGNRDADESLQMVFDVQNVDFVIKHWTEISMILQLAVAAVLLIITIRNVNPLPGKKLFGGMFHKGSK